MISAWYLVDSFLQGQAVYFHHIKVLSAGQVVGSNIYMYVFLSVNMLFQPGTRATFYLRAEKWSNSKTWRLNLHHRFCCFSNTESTIAHEIDEQCGWLV